METFRIFKHYVHTAFLLLGCLELFVLFLSVYAGVYIRLSGEIATEVSSDVRISLFGRAVAYSCVLMISFISLGMYQFRFGEVFPGFSKKLLVSLGIGFAILAFLYYVFPALHLGRGILLISFAITGIAITLVRIFFLKLVDQETLKKRIIVYGAGERARKICALWKAEELVSIDLIGFVRIEGEQVSIDEERVIYPLTDLQTYARKHKAEEVVVAPDDRRKNFPLDELLDCKLNGMKISEPVSFLEKHTGKVNIDAVHPGWMIFSDGFGCGLISASIKRAFDIILALLILFVFLPVMLLVALGSLIESKGKAPILYRQVRVGENGRTFDLLKFRSMVVDAERGGQAIWAMKNDNRVTKLGGIIRKYRIDELPQLFNILKGEMSLIGPRPERPEFVKDLSTKIAFYDERHRIKPGLAGWAQMNYPYGASEKDAIEKLQYDLYYVKNHSLFLDLYILMQTAEVVLWAKGVR